MGGGEEDDLGYGGGPGNSGNKKLKRKEGHGWRQVMKEAKVLQGTVAPSKKKKQKLIVSILNSIATPSFIV